MEDPRLLHVDPGGFSNYYTESGPEKTAAIVDIYEAMGLDVVNVSARELADDADRLIALVDDRNTPYISANLVEEATNKPIFPDHVVLDIDGHRIAIIGVTQRVIKSWEQADGSIIVTLDPEEVLPLLVKKLENESDAIILLAHLPRVRLQKLLEKTPGIDVVIGTDGYSLTSDYQEVAGIPVSYAGRQGEALGFLRFHFSEDGLKVSDQQVVRLTTDLPEDPEIKAMVDEVLEEIGSSTVVQR